MEICYNYCDYRKTWAAGSLTLTGAVREFIPSWTRRCPGMQLGVWIVSMLSMYAAGSLTLPGAPKMQPLFDSAQRCPGMPPGALLVSALAVQVCSQELDSSLRCPGMQPGVWLCLALWVSSQEFDSAWRCPGMQPGLRLSSSLPGNSAVVWLSSALSGCVAMSLTQLGTVRVQYVARSLTQLDVVAGYAAGSLTQRGLGQCKTVGKCFVCCLNYIQNGNNHNSS